MYTKKGDFGETSLADGKRVFKNHPRVECYGMVDELNSYLGLLRSFVKESDFQNELLAIQRDLFIIQSNLAVEEISLHPKFPKLIPDRVIFLEECIDTICEKIPLANTFVVPGGTGSVVSSHAQVARCICRRTERQLILFSRENEINPTILAYINRLSDYLFSLANIQLYKDGKENIPILF